MDSTDIVFSKTEKGRDEMAKRSHGLNPAQRRILILIDGSKTVAALAEMNTALAAVGQFDEILAFLEEHGFIVSAGARGDSTVSTAVAAPNVPQPAVGTVVEAIAERVPAENMNALRVVKDFMTTTAQTYLGLLSAPLIQRIEQARNASQLKSVVGQWSMALRDSAQGRRFADAYLEQVRSALAGGAAPVLSADT